VWFPRRASISSMRMDGLESPSCQKWRRLEARSRLLSPNVSTSLVFNEIYLSSSGGLLIRRVGVGWSKAATT
jgi:hypothetical protein